MTGQVDEAGRDEDPAVAIELRRRAATVQALTSEVAGLRTQLAEAETLLRSMDHFADVAETCERKSNAYAAENARLAGQVAAIRALADAWVKRSAPNASSAYQDCSADVRAALVASSPTTPEATK